MCKLGLEVDILDYFFLELVIQLSIVLFELVELLLQSLSVVVGLGLEKRSLGVPEGRHVEWGNDATG